MKTFDLYHPPSLESALKLLSEGAPATAKLLAGGQDLLTELKEHLEEPERVIDIKRIPGLDSYALDAGRNLNLGPLVTLVKLEEDQQLPSGMAALREAAASVASPQIRSLATVGGNLNQRPRCWYYRNEATKCLKKGGTECFAYEGMNRYNAILGGGPSYIVHPSDLAPALVCLGAEVTLTSASGERTLPLEEFFVLPSEGDVLRESVRTDEEIMSAVRVPGTSANARSTYLKFKERSSFDWALSAVALMIEVEGDTIREARLVLGGVAPVPWRCKSAEELLKGAKLEMKTFKAAAEAALEEADPLEHNAFKVPLTRGLIIKALLKLQAA